MNTTRLALKARRTTKHRPQQGWKETTPGTYTGPSNNLSTPNYLCSIHPQWNPTEGVTLTITGTTLDGATVVDRIPLDTAEWLARNLNTMAHAYRRDES